MQTIYSYTITFMKMKYQNEITSIFNLIKSKFELQ